MLSTAPERSLCFISYSHEDGKYFRRLTTALKPYERHQALTIWHDQCIASGQDWYQGITQALDRARVAILLVSPDFLASDFINQEELPKLLGAAEGEGVVLLPIIIRSCAYTDSKLRSIQALNGLNKPVNEMTEGQADRLWQKAAEMVHGILSAAPCAPISALDTDMATLGTSGATPIEPGQVADTHETSLKLAAIDYLNLPRLLDVVPEARSLLSGLSSVSASNVQSLRGMGLELGLLLAQLRVFLRTWSPDTVSIARIAEVSSGSAIPSLVQFDSEFHRKNFAKAAMDMDGPFRLTGYLEKDPHMYCRIGQIKVYFPLTPRWVTTDTAIGDFLQQGGGYMRFAGFGVVKYVDTDKAIVTPLVIGIPEQQSWFHRL